MGLYIKVKEIRQIREIAIHLIFSRGDNPPPPPTYSGLLHHILCDQKKTKQYIF